MVAEPKTEHLVMVLLLASAFNKMVQVPDAAEVLELDIVKLFPPVFNPSKVTLSAPAKVMMELAKLPVIVLAAPPLGEMVILV
jgi:hypothetical protein